MLVDVSAFFPPVKLGHMYVDSRQPSGRANITLDTIKGNMCKCVHKL